jgi:hypothetical protein
MCMAVILMVHIRSDHLLAQLLLFWLFCCCSCSSLSSKVVSQHSSFMSPMAVESVLRVMDPQHANL